jgi:hypothetical protein
MELLCEKYLARSLPVVIPGAVEDWPALARWSADYLRSIPTPRPVPVDVYPDGNFFSIGGALGHRQRTHLPFARYLEVAEVPSGARYYAPDLELARYFPKLTEDLGRPPLPPLPIHPRLFLFAGYQAITAGHFHPFTHALICQVTGRKRVVLYPPEAGPSLYPHPWFSPAFFWSRIDFLHPDHVRFPALREVRGLECILEPGDAVFIPVHWWHWTQGFAFSVSVLSSWTAALREWRFPQPGWACLFARCVGPFERRARSLLSHAKSAVAMHSFPSSRRDEKP